MTAILLGGAAVGLGAFVLLQILLPPRVPAGNALVRLDLARRQQREYAAAVRTDPRAAETGRLTRSVGRRTAGVLGGWGIELGRLRADLALLGRPLDVFLAGSVLGAAAGFVSPLVVSAVLALVGAGVGVSVPVLLAVVLGVIGAVVPALVVRSRAADRRRDFRHVVGSFLDLVAMSLAGGRGVPESLQGAAELSDGWAMIRIRDALSEARLRGETPWAALGQLGEEVQVDELRDLAAALALVAEDGAKVRDSLTARSDSMRRRELALSEGKAGEDSQSMLVAQLLLAVGFLIFLLYPAMTSILGSGAL